MITDERNHFKNTITGKLEFDTTFSLFKINTEQFKTHKEWAALVKKHKYAFESLMQANDLIKALLNFKVKIETETEKGKDNKGNVTEEYRRKVIDSSLPDTFELKLPIFKGNSPVVIPCEFEVADGDLSLSLWSDFIQVEVNKARDFAINEVLGDIRKIAPDIAILEK